MKFQCILASLGFAILLCVPVFGAGIPGFNPPTSPVGKPTVPDKGDGLRVFHIGNSHSHQMHWGLGAMAVATGHTKHSFAYSNILGAPLGYIWEHDEGCQGGRYTVNLAPDKPWDVVTLQTMGGGKEPEYAVKFAGLAYQGNPKCQICMHTIWPGGADDWDNPKPGTTEQATEVCAAAIMKAFPDAPPVRVIPGSLVMREVARHAERGEIPNVPNRWALQTDGGHLSDYGSYVLNLTVCSLIYDEPPFPYPNGVFNHDRKFVEFPAETAEPTKRIVWDVLTGYATARMNNVGLLIADRSLPTAILDRPYRIGLKAQNAQGPCTWSVAKGECPPGLALSADGTLSGTPTKAGVFSVLLRIADGKGQSERPMTLYVAPDAAPSIPDPALRTIALDDYVHQALKADGGVGRLTWKLAAGQLPHGVLLMPNGLLVGTPGESNRFDFTLAVSDSHPAGPRSAEKPLSWQIGPASPRALFIKPIDNKEGKSFVADGKLDEPFWKLDQAIAKPVKGRPGKRAAFGAVWTPGGLLVAVKVQDGPAGKTPNDGVEVFIDGAHDCAARCGIDDTHFVVHRSGKATFKRTGDPWWFLQSTAAEAADGYVVEMRIGMAYFVGQGSTSKFEANNVFGFDIAVDEGAGQLNQQVWQGTADNAEDASAYGSIVLAAPAGVKVLGIGLFDFCAPAEGIFSAINALPSGVSCRVYADPFGGHFTYNHALLQNAAQGVTVPRWEGTTADNKLNEGTGRAVRP